MNNLCRNLNFNMSKPFILYILVIVFFALSGVKANAYMNLKGHTGGVSSLSVYDGKIISGSFDKTIKIWDIASGKLIRTLSGHTESVISVTASDGKIISGSEDNTIKIWDLPTGQLINTFIDNDCIYSVKVLDEKIISGSRDKTIKIWDLRKGLLLNTLSGHTNQVTSVTASDGKIISGSLDHTIKIWDIESGKLTNTLSGHTSSVRSVSVYDGKIISGSDDNTIKIWDLASGKLINTLSGHTNNVLAVTVSEGKIISGSIGSETIKIWTKQDITAAAEFEKIKKMGGESEYKAFILKHPDYSFPKEVLQDWVIAKKANTINAYYQFIQMYKGTSFADKKAQVEYEIIGAKFRAKEEKEAREEKKRAKISGNQRTTAGSAPQQRSGEYTFIASDEIDKYNHTVHVICKDGGSAYAFKNHDSHVVSWGGSFTGAKNGCAAISIEEGLRKACRGETN